MHGLLFDWPYAGLALAAALVVVNALNGGWPRLLGRAGGRPLPAPDRA